MMSGDGRGGLGERWLEFQRSSCNILLEFGLLILSEIYD